MRTLHALFEIAFLKLNQATNCFELSEFSLAKFACMFLGIELFCEKQKTHRAASLAVAFNCMCDFKS